jgi:hypothetical protein
MGSILSKISIRIGPVPPVSSPSSPSAVEVCSSTHYVSQSNEPSEELRLSLLRFVVDLIRNASRDVVDVVMGPLCAIQCYALMDSFAETKKVIYRN